MFSGESTSKYTVLLWRQDSISHYQRYEASSGAAIHTHHIVGEGYAQSNYMQLLISEEVGLDLSGLLSPEDGLTSPTPSVSESAP